MCLHIGHFVSTNQVLANVGQLDRQFQNSVLDAAITNSIFAHLKTVVMIQDNSIALYHVV